MFDIAEINQEGGPGLGLSCLGSNGGLELGGRLNVIFSKNDHVSDFDCVRCCADKWPHSICSRTCVSILLNDNTFSALDARVIHDTSAAACGSTVRRRDGIRYLVPTVQSIMNGAVRPRLFNANLNLKFLATRNH
jgi:hypothetical protein